MSSRTAASSRAIREAWENEKRLVLEGKGTRDWPEEQQKQIVEKGKAYDDKGLALEGQHMKSFSAHPEYRDDPRNIQFLSRREHLAAHGGNWTNQTNGYYDPALKVMSDFGNSPPQPCVELILTNPLYVDSPNASSTQTSGDEKEVTSSPNATAASTGSLRRWTHSLQRAVQQASKDPRVRALTVSVIATVATGALNRAGSNRTRAPSTQPSMRAASAPGTDLPTGGRQSPGAHGVSGYTKKNGTNVQPYRRGGTND
ncbi:hypothetical protein [Aeromicrobium sp. 9AM]|uniref:hypothetical protein n=1 Tax=Aeromicrobium sp. 9AM TaxID=2653126 RepID=UPI0012F17C71|nr:hypothetical protein [Aeromicrobium sp. 9AM]VXB78300.1 conserved hypothetical protein [Aeromicrobium sp. 9AM]